MPKYQARIKVGAAAGKTAYANGWYNLDVARSVGWHHGRMVIGAISGTANPVSFYIDDMSTPALTGTMNSEINGLELVTEWKPGAYNDTSTVNWPDGAMYDDIVFGTPQDAPGAPAAAAATSVTVSGMTWNWTQSGTVDGFHVFDAATLGAMKGGDLAATSYSRRKPCGEHSVFALRFLLLRSGEVCMVRVCSNSSGPDIHAGRRACVCSDRQRRNQLQPGIFQQQRDRRPVRRIHRSQWLRNWCRKGKQVCLRLGRHCWRAELDRRS